MRPDAARCCVLLGAVAVVACGGDRRAPGGDQTVVLASEPRALAEEDPAEWSCQRYGDVADENSDSYDDAASRRAERYMLERVKATLGERGIEPEVGDEPPARWTGLLDDICVEWPDLVLEAAAGRVAEGLP